jgi:hypothetical protein
MLYSVCYLEKVHMCVLAHTVCNLEQNENWYSAYCSTKWLAAVPNSSLSLAKTFGMQ